MKPYIAIIFVFFLFISLGVMPLAAKDQSLAQATFYVK
jgi:hypothetical protein